MKNVIKLFFALLFTVAGLQSQVLIYNQNFNDSSSGLPPANWSNTQSCLWVTSATNQSTGYPNATAGGNLYAGCVGYAEVIASQISTSGYTNLTLMFGARKGASEIFNLELSWSNDGVTYTPIVFNDVSSGSGWALVNGGTAITLPSGCENQANLRFKFRITNSPNNADYRIDDLRITGIAPPTKLFITSIIGSVCAQPQVGIPFSVTVQSRDANNIPTNVTTATDIQLTSSPPGIISTTQPIAINTNSVTISGVVSNTAGPITITATPISGMTLLTPYTTPFFGINALPTGLAFYNLQNTGVVNNVHPSFSVIVTPNDSCYNNQVVLHMLTAPPGGMMIGTLSKPAGGGLAYFSDIIFTQPGVYTINATSSTLSPAPTATITITTAPPVFTQIIMPLYMQGKSGINDERLHTAVLAEITNLTPFVTYRYYTRAVSTTDNVTEVGNSIYANTTGVFKRSISPDLTTPNEFGTIVADGLGKFRGWFMLEPTGDLRFAAGQEIKLRVVLDGGNNGILTHTLTSTQTITCLTFGSNPLSPTEGSSFFVPSNASNTIQERNFLLFYRGDTLGTGGRPIAINVIESDGLNLTGVTEYFSHYRNSIDGQIKACEIIEPNLSPFGITFIEERSLSGGLLMGITDAAGGIVSTATSPSGIWPPGVSTINPTNGSTPLAIRPEFIILSVTHTSGIASEYKLNQNYPNPFNPSTKIDFSLPKSSIVELRIYDVLGREVYTLLNEEFAAGNYSIDFNASRLSSGMYFYKLTAGEFSEVKKMVLIK